MNNPLVSIAVTAYNHEAYIARTLDCILMQKTNFEYQIIIGEDCGTDNTIAILKAYQEKYPKRIKLLDSIKNYGIEQNLLRTIKACSGTYIAICDGDDYWITDDKLQIQVNFLVQHKTYGTVATLRSDFFEKDAIFINQKLLDTAYKTYSFSEVLFNNPITPSSVLFRKKLMVDYIRLYENNTELSFNDYNFFIFFAHEMKVAKLNKITTVYNMLQESGSRSVDLVKVWDFRKRFYNGIKFYLSHYNVDSTLKNEVLYHKAIEYYRMASYSQDFEVCQELLQVFKNNNDTLRYMLLKWSLKQKSVNKIALFIEKINLRLNLFKHKSSNLG